MKKFLESPFLLIISFGIFFFLKNIDELQEVLLGDWVLYFIVLFSIFLFCFLTLKKQNKTKQRKIILIFITTFILLFLSVDLHLFLNWLVPAVRFRISFSILFITFSYLLYRLISTKNELKRISFYFNSLFFLLTFQIIVVKLIKVKDQNEGIPEINIKGNFYFLIFDGYANSKSLNEFWEFNNSEFETKLKELGFVIFPNSITDYYLTSETLASVLNFRKLKLEEIERPELQLNLIKKNLLFKGLLKKKYKIINFSSFNFEGTINKNAIWYFKKNSNLFYYIWDRSIIGFSLNNFDYQNSFQKKIKRDNNIFTSVKKIAKLKNKQLNYFLISHNFDLHYPYEDKLIPPVDKLFNYNYGKVQTLGNTISDKVLQKHYLTQLINLNTKILEEVNTIRVNDPTSTILICSDHGFRLLTGVDGRIAKKEAKMNFVALYSPNGVQFNLNKNISLLEIVKLIFLN